MFCQKLYETDWTEIVTCEKPREFYKMFLRIIMPLYMEYFPTKKIKLKQKDMENPWKTARIKKSSKRKTHWYEKFLEMGIQRSEIESKYECSYFSK